MELIFIHLPKTAGSSLRALLHSIYGRGAVVTVGVDIEETKTAIHESLLPKGTKVLTGHISYSQVKALHQSSGAKIVSFLRDPIERYISHFFHLKRSQTRSLGLQHQLQSQLPFWVHLCLIRYHNVMSRSLKPLPLKKFDFIGFHHTFRDDLSILASLMHWPEETLTAWDASTSVNANANKEFPQSARAISKAAFILARLANTDDEKLYTQALASRRRSVRSDQEMANGEARCDKS